MSTTETFRLTTKDHTILEVMRERSVALGGIVPEILRRKLSKAIVVFREDVPPDVVTLNSRVTYRIDDGPAETRIVAQEEMQGLVGQLLPISHPRALALIGLAEDESMTIPKPDGGTETLRVVQVIYQPEAARRERLGLAVSLEAQPVRHGPGFLRLVHDADALPGTAPKRPAMSAGYHGPDDPGPSAA